jgi:hypothetical protein
LEPGAGRSLILEEGGMSDEATSTGSSNSEDTEVNRLQQLVEAGVVPKISDFSADARKVIRSLTDTEFQSVLSIRKTILSVAGEDALRESDRCMSFVW